MASPAAHSSPRTGLSASQQRRFQRDSAVSVLGFLRSRRYIGSASFGRFKALSPCGGWPEIMLEKILVDADFHRPRVETRDPGGSQPRPPRACDAITDH